MIGQPHGHNNRGRKRMQFSHPTGVPVSPDGDDDEAQSTTRAPIEASFILSEIQTLAGKVDRIGESVEHMTERVHNTQSDVAVIRANMEHGSKRMGENRDNIKALEAKTRMVPAMTIVFCGSIVAVVGLIGTLLLVGVGAK